LCLAGLEEVYGLEFAAVEVLDSGGPLTLAALGSGRVDVALLFTTNGALAGGELVLLEDDRGLQPAENVVPVLRQAIASTHGQEVVEVVERVTARLDEQTLVDLNRRLDRGEDPATVASGWLASHGLR
jgi:osmoprotectant transport system substrate-binding protein